MKFEHFALNVADVRAMARWYVEHLGFQIARRRE
ncbi:MAG: VOC family protein, partial [Opitutaceae bacterium]|nr:VOC family protein [Opitutaceae bacterium]